MSTSTVWPSALLLCGVPLNINFLQEMSPIDGIVPLHHTAYSDRYGMETSIDLIPNHHIYHSGTGDDNLMSGNSNRPLIRDHPQAGRPAPQVGKQSAHVSVTSVLHCPCYI